MIDKSFASPDSIIFIFPEEEYCRFILLSKSDLYFEKSNAILNGDSNVNSKIPIDLWLSAAENASNYFLLIEDDFWFTTAFNLKKFRLKTDFSNIT